MKTILIILILAAGIFKTSESFAQINVQDSLALVDLYHKCEGEHWIKHTNWLTKAPVSTWYGIFYIFNGEVGGIELSSNNLKGTLPASIGTMPGLNSFFIVSDNSISGPIPASMKKIKSYDFEINNNKFNFNDIEGLAVILDSPKYNFVYSPQANLTLHYNAGIFSTSAGGTLADETFHWYKNGKLITTIVGDSTYKTSSAGKYYVAVTNKIATELTLYSDTITIAAQQIAGESFDKASPSSASSFNLYPNPGKDILNVKFSSLSGNAAVSLYDINGKKLQELTQGINDGSNIQINTSQLTSGSYFVDVMINGKEYTEEFIKQ